MTIKELVKELCKREGLKTQSSIANVRELIGHLSDMVHGESWVEDGTLKVIKNGTLFILINNGAKRAKKKARKK